MKYSTPELLFYPIYTDQALLNIPQPTHKPLLLTNTISNTTRNPHHSSTYLEESNKLKCYSDHDNFSPSLLPSPSPSFSTLSTPSLKHHIIESTTISKQYHENQVPSTSRLYYPLRHQQGVWSYSRLHQYYPLLSRPIIPHHLYHQTINLLYPLLLSPLLLSRV